MSKFEVANRILDQALLLEKSVELQKSSAKCLHSECQKISTASRAKLTLANHKQGNRLDQTKRTSLEVWLRYADDLGLGPYYRDRARGAGAAGVSVESPAAVQPQQQAEPRFAA